MLGSRPASLSVDCRGERGHGHVGAGGVGEVEGVDVVAQQLGLLHHVGKVGALRRVKLRRNEELSGLDGVGEAGHSVLL